MDDNEQEILQFQYPIGDDIEHLEALMYREVNGKMTFKRSTFFLILGTLFMLLSVLLLNSLIIYIIGLFMIFFAIGIAKRSLFAKHLLEIEAYESYVFLRYYNTANDMITELMLDYADIKGCLIDTDDYTSVRLIYSLGSEKSNQIAYRLSNNKEVISERQSGEIFIRLNPNTPEQAFFLYSASKLFNTNYKQWKIVKRFGTEEEYYSRIYNQIT